KGRRPNTSASLAYPGGGSSFVEKSPRVAARAPHPCCRWTPRVYFLRNFATFSSSFFASSEVYSRNTSRLLVGSAESTRFKPLPSLCGQADPILVQNALGSSPSATALSSTTNTLCDVS